jgi:hypothetical protein
MSETDRKLDRLIELTEEQMRGRGSSRGPSIGSSGGFDFLLIGLLYDLSRL